MTPANPSESGDYYDEYEERESARHHDAPESPPEPPTRAHGDTLAVMALMIPLVAGGLLLACRTDSAAFVLAVSLGAVGLTALLLAVDAARLGSVDRKGTYRGGAGGLFVGMLLIWVLVYPAAYFRRRHFGRPNYGPLAILVAALFLAGPLVQNYALFGVFGNEPPTCTSREVMSMVEDIVRKSPGRPAVVSISGHRELSYDKARKSRKGQCLLKTGSETVTVNYTVTTPDRGNGGFLVEVEPFFLSDPPQCTDPAVVALLESVLRTGPNGHALQTVTGHQEVRYDRDEKIRHGRCRATLPDWSGDVHYKVYWADQKIGAFQVEVEE